MWKTKSKRQDLRPPVRCHLGQSNRLSILLSRAASDHEQAPFTASLAQEWQPRNKHFRRAPSVFLADLRRPATQTRVGRNGDAIFIPKCPHPHMCTVPVVLVYNKNPFGASEGKRIGKKMTIYYILQHRPHEAARAARVGEVFRTALKGAVRRAAARRYSYCCTLLFILPGIQYSRHFIRSRSSFLRSIYRVPGSQND